MAKRERLDVICVARGVAPTRQKAQALILAGQVLVNGHPVTKAGTGITADAEVARRGEPPRFVSRGGLKLEALLDASALDVAERVALDIGASTGGFTDCLLQRGARHVIAVDVGYGQLAWKLRSDPRVTSVERTNARNLDRATLREACPEQTPWPPELATIDVSFISLRLVLPAVARVLDAGQPVAALIKPQFEAGRGAVGKGGVVAGEDRERAIVGVLDWARDAGYTLVERTDSPIAGPRGNVEHLALWRTPRPIVDALPGDEHQ